MCLVKVVCFDPRNTPFDAKHDLMTLPFYVPPPIYAQKSLFIGENGNGFFTYPLTLEVIELVTS